MFVSQESLGAIQNYYFINDKGLPTGNNSERFVSQFLELSCNPKGNPAYKLFSTMQEEKKFVDGNAVCVISTPNLADIATALGLTGASAIKIYFKANKVTASCKLNGRTFGAKSNCVHTTLQRLVSTVQRFQPTNSTAL